MPSRRSLPLLFALVSALLAGCASTDLEGSDRGVLMPTVRAVFDLSEGGEGDQDSGPMRFDHGFELAATGASDSMVLDGVVGGPGDVSYQALHGSALYRVGFDGRRAAVHGLVGVGVDRVELTDNPLVRGEEGYAGPMVGVEAELRVRDWFAPYLRLTTQVMDQGAFSQQFEIGARFPTCSAADVLVAWRSWDAEYEDLARTGQDLEVDWRGFVLGFGLRF